VKGRAWNRVMWGVEQGCKHFPNERLIIGKAWHIIKNGDYPGEPARCLLFTTRKYARQWCKIATEKSRSHSPDWWFRPVRVRETVTKP